MKFFFKCIHNYHSYDARYNAEYIAVLWCSLYHSSKNGHIPSTSSHISLSNPQRDPNVSEEYGRVEMGEGDSTRT